MTRRLAAALLVSIATGWIGSPLAGAVEAEDMAGLRWRLLGPFRGGWATCAAGAPGEPADLLLRQRRRRSLAHHRRRRDLEAALRRAGERLDRCARTGAERPDASSGSAPARFNSAGTSPPATASTARRDGGETWKHVGLADTRHIGRIWVDPRDADVALVAALGHLFGPNDERGVFRTDDGGAHLEARCCSATRTPAPSTSRPILRCRT